MLKKVLFSTLVSSAILCAESGVGLNVNEKDLEVEGILDSRNLAALQTTSTIYQGDVNFINVDETSKLLGAGIMATNKLEGLEGVELSFGGKFIWAEVGSNNFTAFPLMAKVRYVLPPLMFSIPPVSLEGKVLYAPKVLAFGDSEKYTEYRVNAEIEMIENVRVYTGYRNIHTKYNGVSSDLFNTGFYAGLKLTY